MNRCIVRGINRLLEGIDRLLEGIDRLLEGIDRLLYGKIYRLVEFKIDRLLFR